MKETLKVLANNGTYDRFVYKPVFFRLGNSRDRERLEELLRKSPETTVFDELEGQLCELVKMLHPKITFKHPELLEAAHRHLGGISPEEYGVWVYYPWSRKLVHLLDEEEFTEVRTSRNQYKITREERDLLSQKIVGIVGLSVGKVIAVTMAMERSFGELRLADFDTVELSNLNRIQTAVHNLGIFKPVVTAREIAEIDPFLRVTCYTEGLTEQNMDDFFLQGGKLNLLVEECDGLDIKITCRYKARALGIPVVMEMNDRATLDVERFDLEPERPLLHGFIDHLDHTRIKNLTNEEKVPYLLPMLGADTISAKLKASLMEVGQTITTWPQPASVVTLGGALVADVYRRIMLGSFNDSGRYFVDLEQLICDRRPDTPPSVTVPSNPGLDKEGMIRMLQEVNPQEIPGQMALSPTLAEKLVTAATLAPSGGNSQPWKWLHYGSFLCLFLDESRTGAFLDFRNAASYISLGTATENLVLAAHREGLEVSLETFPAKGEGKLAVIFRFAAVTGAPDREYEPHDMDYLEAALETRFTNRQIHTPQNLLEPSLLEALEQTVSSVKGAALHFIQRASGLEQAAEIIAKADRIRLLNQTAHHDFVNEIRWTPEEALAQKDGIDLATIDLTPSEKSGLEIARSWDAVMYLKKWKGGGAFEKLGRKNVAAASALGVVTIDGFTPRHLCNAGRAVQRMWLKAHQLGLSLQPMTAATFLFARLEHGNGEELDNEDRAELSRLRQQFVRLFALERERHDVFLFRLFRGDTPEVKSLRRPLEDVLYRM
jgi:hypothetical protein